MQEQEVIAQEAKFKKRIVFFDLYKEVKVASL
jgi:hypothetical protein